MKTNTAPTEQITVNINVSPVSDPSDLGRDWQITADSEIAAVQIAQDRAEKLGIGQALYCVSATRFSPTTAFYATTGSAGRGYILHKK